MKMIMEEFNLKLKDKKMSDVTLQWKRITNTAKPPQKAHAEDAAWDLFADTPDQDIYIGSGLTKIIPTGLAIMPPAGWCCDIRGRSGMNSKGKLVILGLVDSFYTGPWGVVIHNASQEFIKISHHDKIAQFTVQRVWESKLEQVENFDISENSRGTSGFGSSGVK